MNSEQMEQNAMRTISTVFNRHYRIIAMYIYRKADSVTVIEGNVNESSQEYKGSYLALHKAQGGSPSSSLLKSEGSWVDQWRGEAGPFDWRPKISKLSYGTIRLEST
jgi:hypothetical protein